MKSIVSFFNDFLRDEVNLNRTRLKVASNGIKTIGRFLRSNELFKGNIIEIKPQGSYRQGTITKPFDDDSDFDVDLLVLLDEFDDWQPKDYLNKLHQEFKRTKRYKDIVDRKGKSRCVTIDYESDFHIDIVPAIKKNGRYKIMNKNSNEFESTDGDGYAQWFEEKNSITSSNFLIKTVRLVKYLRDFKQTFSIKSVLLTTLLGKQVYESDSYYKDLPTTLKTLFNRLDHYLQARPFLTEEIITNPILLDEKFSRYWDQDTYFNFRNKVHNYNIWINEAYKEGNANEAVKKWRKIFGDDFGEIQELSSSLSAYSRTDSREYREEFIDNFYTEDLDNSWKLVISVTPHQSIGGFRPLHYRKNESLIFYVDSDKSFLPKDVAFKWKVKNSGIESKSSKDLRGKIENDISGNGVKHEMTGYKGKHYVECYALIKNTVIATDSIYVNVVN